MVHSRSVNSPLRQAQTVWGGRYGRQSGTQPSDLVPPTAFSSQGQDPSPRVGLFEDELRVMEPQELFANRHVHPCVSASQQRQGQEA